MKQVIPVDVCIKRFYRYYAEVDIDATKEQIRQTIIDDIVEYQDSVIDLDEELEIESDDIFIDAIKYDDAWTTDF